MNFEVREVYRVHVACADVLLPAEVVSLAFALDNPTPIMEIM